VTSLTLIAYQTRKLIKVGGLFTVFFLISWTLITSALKAYEKAHPIKEKPTVKYGILPKIVFPEKVFDSKSFSKELANDKFPVSNDQAKVYFVARSNKPFMALDEDKKTAKLMGFENEPKEIGNGVYEFKNNLLNQTLTINVFTGSFKMKYPYENDQMLLNPERILTKEEAIVAAKSYLSDADKLPDDLNLGEQKISYWKIAADGLRQVDSPSEANMTRVDLFRKNINDEMKIVSSNPNTAPISLMVTGSTVEGKKVVEVNYHYANIDRESYETYPIKSAEEAWGELKAGNYWPANDIANKEVTIRKIYLAYFEPVVLTNYLQPVYVFEGDNNFTAYVPAIIDKYLK